jgi:hypothetical protein
MPVLDRSSDLLGRLPEETPGDLELLATMFLHVGLVVAAFREAKLNIA